MNEKDEEISRLREEVVRLRKALAETGSPLPVLLRRRGFRIFRKEPPEDLLIPDKKSIDDYYRYMHRYSFRLFLRDVIKHQKKFSLKDVTRYATVDVTRGYIDLLLAVGLLEKKGNSYSLTKRPIKSFGPTLEWFLSEIFKREFSAETAWGIKFKRPVVGGDYDLIAKFDNSVLYMEIKSSPPKQIYDKEISAFFDRTFDLVPDIAMFFMDTELRMKDKIVPMFEGELGRRSPDELSAYSEKGETPSVMRLEKELFHIQNKIFIINAKDSIVNNLEKVLSQYFRKS